MKIKDGFMLREVADQWVVVPLGERVVEFSGIMSLSESGALIWRHMEQNDVEEEALVSLLLTEYEIDEKIAKQDVHEFIEKIKDKQLLT